MERSQKSKGESSMRMIMIVGLVAMVAGCNGVNLAWRGVVINTTQDVDSNGMIHNQPTSGSSSVAAEKTTDAKLDVPLVK